MANAVAALVKQGIEAENKSLKSNDLQQSSKDDLTLDQSPIHYQHDQEEQEPSSSQDQHPLQQLECEPCHVQAHSEEGEEHGHQHGSVR